MINKKVYSPMSPKGNICIGLVGDIPSVIDRGTVKSLNNRHPLICRTDLKDGPLFFSHPLKLADPITWVHSSEYWWEDTLTFRKPYWGMRTETIWYSRKFDTKLHIKNTHLKPLMDAGVKPGGVFEGPVTLYIHGNGVWAYPTAYK